MPVVLTIPIKVRPAPALDPPFDDERTGAGGPADDPGQPTLPLDWSRSRPRHRPGRGPGRVSPAGGQGTHATTRAAFPVQAAKAGQASTDAAERPGPGARPWPPSTHGRPAAMTARAAAGRFLALSLEVLNGFRPVVHLRPQATPNDFPAISDQVTRALARMSASRARPRARPRKLLVCEPRPGVAEAAAVVDHGDRVWAMAFRLERRPTGWLCTAAQIL